MGEDPLRAAFLLTKKEKCGYFFEKERFYKLVSFGLCVYVQFPERADGCRSMRLPEGLRCCVPGWRVQGKNAGGVKAFHLAELLFPEKEKNPRI